jgi:hypothetical protein
VSAIPGFPISEVNLWLISGSRSVWFTIYVLSVGDLIDLECGDDYD